MKTIRVLLAIPFYMLALVLIKFANIIGGTTFLIKPKKNFIPNVTNYTGSMEDDSQ